MAWESIRHRCGHSEKHQLAGPGSDRDRKRQWLETTVCAECYTVELQAKREVELANAKAAAAENGLPPLSGTEKQVSWAERIRAEKLEAMLKEFERNPLCILGITRVNHLPEDIDQQGLKKLYDNGSLKTHLRPLVYKVAAARTTASWWIDNRQQDLSAAVSQPTKLEALSEIRALISGQDPEQLMTEKLNEERAKKAAADEALRLKLAADAEATVRPEQCTQPAAAEIRIEGRAVTVTYPERNATLLEIVHRFESQWDERRHVIACLTNPREIAVEIGHRLLAAGFTIQLWDAELRSRAVAGDYVPYNGRAISANTEGSHFVVWWSSKLDPYGKRPRVPGGRYEDKQTRVPRTGWRDLADFAELHSFTILRSAQKLFDACREADAAILPEPVGPVPAVATAPGRPQLSSDEPEIPEHLLDD